MFVDTNVLVIARALNAPDRQLALDVLGRTRRTERLRISRQIVREYLAVVTRPQVWGAPLPMSEALLDVARFSASFEMLEDGPTVMDMLATLCGEVPVSGKQVHDANIVATMLAHGERRLVTFNAKDFQRYGERIELMGMGQRR